MTGYRSDDATGTSERNSTVLVVDDHELFAEGLVLLLRERAFDAHRIVPTTATAVLESAARLRPGVALLDLTLRTENGAAEVDGAELVHPLRVRGWTVLIITGEEDVDRIAEAISEGAINWFLKRGDFSALAEAVTKAAAGHGRLPEPERVALIARHRDNYRRRQHVLDRLRRLSPRERDVLERLAHGHSPEVIAADIWTSIGTVRSHIRSILLKLEVHSQLAAVAVINHRLPAPRESGRPVPDHVRSRPGGPK